MANKYGRDVSHIKTLDPYRLQELYQMHPCAEHVVKKMLAPGTREGCKDLDTDISDCIRTLTRWQEMRAEDAEYGNKMKLWASAPAWAKYIACDEDGTTYFFEAMPTFDGVDWNPCPDSLFEEAEDLGIPKSYIEARP